MSSLDYGQKGPASGTADSMVIFLHGYGADGADLLGLADPMARHLPNTLFVAPDAPNVCFMNPMGREWCPIPWIDGSGEETARLGMMEAAATLDTWLAEMAAKTGIAPARTILVGFSQGTMMALQVAPRHVHAFAGVVGFSGRLLQPDFLAQEAVQQPPILLIHGDVDEVVPYAEMAAAEASLTSAGFAVETMTADGVGHGISPEGLSRALTFIKGHL